MAGKPCAAERANRMRDAARKEKPARGQGEDLCRNTLTRRAYVAWERAPSRAKTNQIVEDHPTVSIVGVSRPPGDKSDAFLVTSRK
jgi:hypothetical protein